MPTIQIELTDEEDRILTKASEIQRRSKRAQAAFGAVEHARMVVSENSPETKEEQEEN